MAQIVLGLGTSHGPQLSMPASQWPLLVQKDEKDPRIDYQELLRQAGPGMEQEITPAKMQERDDACKRALAMLREVLARTAPDVILVIGDDQHEQFLDDNMPAFCIYRGGSLPVASRSGGRDATLNAAWANAAWRTPEQDSGPAVEYAAAPELGEHMIRYLVGAGFDAACSNRLRADVGLGHAFTFLYRHLLANRNIPVLPVMVNTFFSPNQPTPRRCYALGRAMREAIERWDPDKRVAMVASGGLSHVIIDEDLDRATIDAMLEKDTERLCSLPEDKLTRGTSEIRNWVALAGAVEPMGMTLVDYVPCYRSPAGTGCAMGFAYWT